MKLDFSQIDAKNYRPVEVVDWMDKQLSGDQQRLTDRLNALYLKKLAGLQRELQYLADNPEQLWAMTIVNGVHERADVVKALDEASDADLYYT